MHFFGVREVLRKCVFRSQGFGFAMRLDRPFIDPPDDPVKENPLTIL